MDQYLNHEQKKLVLQVSKKRVLSHIKEGKLKQEQEEGNGVVKESLYAIYLCIFVSSGVIWE